MIGKYISNSRLFQFYLLSILLFLLPFERITTVKEIIFFLLLSLFLFEKLFFSKDFKRYFIKNIEVNIVLIISFFWAMITLLNAINQPYSFNEVITKMSKQYILYFIAFCVVSEIDERRIKTLFYLLILSSIIMSIYGCYQFYNNPIFFQNRVSGFTGAFYRLATLFVLTLPFYLLLIIQSKKYLRFILLFLFLFIVLSLFFTFTRSAWIATIVEILIFVFIFLKRYRKAILVFTVIIITIVVVLSYFSVLPKKILIRGSEKPRIEALNLSIDVIKKYPLTGIGYGKKTFSFYYPSVEEVMHSHNIFINTAVETGLVGALIISIGFFLVLRDLYRGIFCINEKKKLYLVTFLAAITGFLVLNLFDYMYHGWPGQMFWILVGVGYGINERADQYKNLSYSLNNK